MVDSGGDGSDLDAAFRGATAGGCVDRLAEWLRQPDQFDALSAFLKRRGLLGSTRMLMAVVAGSSALTPLSLLAPMERGATPVVALVVGIFGAALASVMTWFWLTRWPTQRQSVVSAVLGTLCVAAWSLYQPSPAVAALACTAAAVTGGYIAFFHSARVLTFNIAVGLIISAIAALRLAHQVDLATAVAAFWLMWLVNISVPLAIRGTSRAMSRYATRSDEDPLTGLLNRRGFFDAVRRVLGGLAPTDHEYLVVVMVDLDDFKSVNDTHGHAAGDRTLLAVADLMRDLAPEGALVCRAGGEEFLMALVSGASDVSWLTEVLCDAIRERTNGVSASVGVASAVCTGFGGAAGDLIGRLVTAADAAMYAAKRDGGDRVVSA
jgi:diguanylate cyclase